MVLTLYHFPPSFPSRAALLVARAVGVDVTVKNLNLFEKEQLNPEFTKINPQHTIPTLTDDEFVIWDSHAIASYLVRSYAADDSLYPQDPKQKAIVDQRLYFDAGTLFPTIRGIFFPVITLGKTTVDEDQKASVQEALSFLDKFLEGGSWVAGNKMTIADFACVASVSSIVGLGLDITAHKNVTAWLARCRSEMPYYEEVNESGAEQMRKAFLSRLQGNKI
ncbi:glutathione S-transferase 1-like [Zootermopsis nevadensis]|uniref:Glutathione S-transferase D7 n=1 Tax=Zootermopsis nevadensis TaxID=136037 RepID=A0A067R3T6_ZOONE|nr:glutathione S-transferase 1-like [Zootermopsis nevadensis]KDR17708.1 Glutathione S-transferase D7 [Zootermopsis nevadensis]